MRLIHALPILALLLGSIADAPAQDKPRVISQRADVFGPDKLWTVHIKLGAKEYDAMQPKGGGFGFGFPKKDFPPKKEEKKEVKKDADPNADVHKNKGFGIEFPFVMGELEFEGVVVKDVGIRYKGNSTYQTSQQGLKRPFKIDINHYVDTQKLHGMGGFGLGNGVMDTTRLRESLAYAVFRAAKVPAPRTAYAQVYLTVADKHDKTYVGVYTLIEPVDKPFLKDHFKNDKGMLLKPERIQGLPYFGEDWSAYKDRYNPKREPTEAQKKRLIDFTKLVNQADDATFNKKIGNFLDVDGFLRFAAANSLIANLDSYFGLGHNYFLYLNSKTNKFHFIPWDMDLSFGGFGFGGQDQTDWSIAQPYMGKNRLTERVLAMKEHNDAYRGHLKTLTTTTFSAKEIHAAITQLEATIKDALA
ncbi:MAG: CotH kinase family protein, partial [Planctomycetes bacterium]|nr:CotH kinase family protein [Planctomycetota bacterium]